MRAALILLGLLILFQLGCTINLAGKNVGSETTNGLAGVVKDGTGSAGNVEVALYSSEFNPTLPVTDSQFYRISKTDPSGKFLFKNVPKGNYSLLVRDRSQSKAAMKRKLLINGSVAVLEVPELFLEKTGFISISLENRLVSAGMIIFLPGTDRAETLDSADIIRKTKIINDVPSVDYTTLRIAAIGQNYGENILGRPIMVSPSETLTVGIWSEWKTQYKIKINTTSTGANISETLSQFPILVRLTNSNFDFTQSNSDGSDLRFSSMNGVTELSYEIEQWDSTNGFATIWVQVPTIFGNSLLQQIRMYSGKPGASTRTSGFKTFSATYGFSHVWHLHQRPTGIALQMLDATIQGNHGIAIQPTTAIISLNSIIGNGISLNGKDQYISTSKPYPAPTNFNLSFWFNSSDTIGGRILGFGTEQTLRSEFGDRQVWMSDTGKISFGVRATPLKDSLMHTITSNKSYNKGLWHFVNCGISSAGMKLYIDGDLVASDTSNIIPASYSGYWKFGFDRLTGWTHIPQREFFSGKMDEVRISNSTETAGWVKLSYENQRQGSNMIVLIKD